MRKPTIQTYIDEGTSISIHCHKSLCFHNAKIDLIALRDRLGPDHGIMHDDIIHKFKCSKCGSKKLGMILHVNARPQMMREHHHSD